MSAASEENYAGFLQEFLVCTTLHKARDIDLKNSNSELYVCVTLGKASRGTKSFENNTHFFYNESFVFEVKTTLFELLRSSIFYELKKHSALRKDITISELHIDLHTVWHQPKHCFFKKWGRLETPIINKNEVKEEASGYLQIDLAIVTQNSNPMNLILHDSESSNLNKWQIEADFDDIEKNLLQNSYTQIQCNIRYIVTIYHGYFVRNSDYYIQYRFHPFKGKTEIAKNTSLPIWNEELSFAWIFPCLAQQFLMQVYVHELLQWKQIAECEIHFGEIAFNGRPALGPTFIHLYESANPLQYFGRILIEVRSELLKEKMQRQLFSRTSWNLDETLFWLTERFQIEFLPIQGDFVHTSGHLCKVNMRIAEHNSNNVDCLLQAQQDKFKLSPLRFFRQEIPFKSCYISALMPDTRTKFESDFFIQEVLDFMKSEIETFHLFQYKYNNQFHMQIKCLKSIVSGILQKIRDGVADKRFDYKESEKRTTWEINRQLYLIDYFSKLPSDLFSYRKKLKTARNDNIETIIDDVLQDLVQQLSRLNSLVVMTRIQDDWPELILSISVFSKEIGLCRLNAKHFLDMHKSRSSNLCWRVRTFMFRDPQCKHSCVNCGCVVATILGCLAIVNEKERPDFLSQIKTNWSEMAPMLWKPTVTMTHFKCNLFVHQAKVRPGFDRSSLCNALLRVVTCEHVAETHVVHGTLSPIWNIVITLPDVVLPGDISWYLQSPPLIAIEFFDADKSRLINLVGCGMLIPSIISRDRVAEASWEDSRMPNYTFCDFMKSKNAVEKFQRLKNATPPPLKWVPMARKGCTYAEVLMSAEFVETDGNSLDLKEDEGSVTIGIPNSIRPNMLNFVLEVIFIGLRNYNKTDALSSGRHRIKITMADLLLVSGLSTSRIHNSFNFLVAYASGIVNLPDQIEYWPSIVAIDVTIKGTNIEHINGAALVPNSKDFLQKNANSEFKFISSSVGETEGTEDTSMNITNTTYTSIAIREQTEDLTTESEDDEESETIEEEYSRKYLNCWAVIRIWLAAKLQKKRPPLEEPITEDWEADTSEMIGERELSWWAKFYNSMYPTNISKRHHLIIYKNDLEKQPEFSGFKDWAIPIDLVEGIGTKRNAPPKEEIYATLKMQILLTPCKLGVDKYFGGASGDTSNSPISQVGAAMLPKYRAKIQKMGELTNIYVRVYIVQALQLKTRDLRSKSDSYVKLTLGSKSFSDRANYVPNRCNPIFGRFFEFDCQLPREHILEIAIVEQEYFRDKVIGTTYIDLENRWHSKHRATVGIANEYSKNGYNCWHNAETPVELLSRLCHQQDIEPPLYFTKYVEVDNSHFLDETIIAKEEDINERLATTVLKKFKELSSFRYSLVPEHVETRSLYRDDCPGLEQGKLQLWVELFDGNKFIPQAIDITPYPPQDFEIRIIVFNVEDVPMEENKDFASRNLSNDIYVVGWCQDASNYQSTDVHQRSYAGEAYFNWRMIFPLKYSLHEDMMVVRCKTDTAEELDMRQPPKIYLQVKDKNLMLEKDFISSLELNLSNMPAPYKSVFDCKSPFARDRKHLNMFRRKSVRGWFPLALASKIRDDGNEETGGKIELEVQVCRQEEAVSRPVGLGRQAPNALAVPKRTDSLKNLAKASRTKPWIKYTLYGVFACVVLGCLFLFFSYFSLAALWP